MTTYSVFQKMLDRIEELSEMNIRTLRALVGDVSGRPRGRCIANILDYEFGKYAHNGLSFVRE